MVIAGRPRIGTDETYIASGSISPSRGLWAVTRSVTFQENNASSLLGFQLALAATSHIRSRHPWLGLCVSYRDAGTEERFIMAVGRSCSGFRVVEPRWVVGGFLGVLCLVSSIVSRANE